MAQEQANPSVRALAFQLLEGCGLLVLEAQNRKYLDVKTKKNLEKAGVMLGQQTLWLPMICKPKSRDLRALLWLLYQQNKHGRSAKLEQLSARLFNADGQIHQDYPLQSDSILLSLEQCQAEDKALLQALGFIALEAKAKDQSHNGRAREKAKPQISYFLRVDSYEKFASQAAELVKKRAAGRPARPNAVMRSMTQNNFGALKAALKACGYKLLVDDAKQSSEKLEFTRKIYHRKSKKPEAKAQPSKPPEIKNRH